MRFVCTTAGLAGALCLPAFSQSQVHQHAGNSLGEGQGLHVAVLGDLDGDGLREWASTNVVPGLPLEVTILAGADGAVLDSLTSSITGDSITNVSIASLGDVSGDGVEDIGHGITIADFNGQNSGSVLVYSGATRNLLYRVDGSLAFEGLGMSMVALGDTNGDGRSDFAVGAKTFNTVSVFSGSDGSLRYTIVDAGGFGTSLSAFGDLNGDGVPDFAAGMPEAELARVYSGVDGSELLTVSPTQATFSFGASVAGVGDVSGDGVPDLLVGAPELGGARLWSGADGSVLGDFFGGHPSDRMGATLVNAGDVDVDGTPDFALGAPQPQNAGAGYVRVVSGRTLQMIYELEGDALGDRFGHGLAAGGDVDGDGFPDLVVGAPSANAGTLDTGTATVISPCPVPIQVYCSAKLNSEGCTPRIAASGDPSLSGPDDLVISADFVLNNQNGIFFWGLGPNGAPFLGGTLCAAPPVKRTPVQFSSGNPGPNTDCSGTYSYAFTHAYGASQGLSAGSSVFGQFWSRDPGQAPPDNSGLTDAVHFVVCP